MHARTHIKPPAPSAFVSGLYMVSQPTSFPLQQVETITESHDWIQCRQQVMGILGWKNTDPSHLHL